MERQRITTIVAIDLSVAFDTVDYDIILDVFEKRFGMSEDAIKWFESYLRPRTLKVNVGASYSSSKGLEFSVPKTHVLALYSTQPTRAQCRM